MAFGEYVVYADEAGDHGPVSKEFPLFVLALCVFRKDEYIASVLPAMHTLKFKYFGHDGAILHEREIRKRLAPFDFLMDADSREPFFEDLNSLIETAPFALIAAVIDKRDVALDENPYRLALDAALLQLSTFLEQRGEHRCSWRTWWPGPSADTYSTRRSEIGHT